MREEILALMRQQSAFTPESTAIVGHGANPGFVSILAKQALLIMQDKFCNARKFLKLRCNGQSLPVLLASESYKFQNAIRKRHIRQGAMENL